VQYSDDTVTTVTKDEVIHAEANAIIKLARDGESGNGSSLFCTHAPCIHCAKLIHGAGINTVYYRNSYRDEFGIDFLNKCNIEVNKV
jgi:dCMP deaminase